MLQPKYLCPKRAVLFYPFCKALKVWPFKLLKSQKKTEVVFWLHMGQRNIDTFQWNRGSVSKYVKMVFFSSSEVKLLKVQ